MLHITFRDITIEDCDFILDIRNNEETRKYLHNNIVLSKADFLKWFTETNPKWKIIYLDSMPIGYVRTSDIAVNSSIKIGMDIDLKYRNKGYAQEAYKLLFSDLLMQGFKKVWLEVLPTNIRAKHIYEKLGFVEICAEENSIIYEKQLQKV